MNKPTKERGRTKEAKMCALEQAWRSEVKKRVLEKSPFVKDFSISQINENEEIARYVVDGQEYTTTFAYESYTHVIAELIEKQIYKSISKAKSGERKREELNMTNSDETLMRFIEHPQRFSWWKRVLLFFYRPRFSKAALEDSEIK